MSDVEPSTSTGTFHGLVIGELSPIKTSSKNSAVKYFDGRFGDEKKTVRLVSFDPKLHTQFEEVKKSGCGVALQNCLVKRKVDDFELHVNSKSSILSSPKKFKVSDDSCEEEYCPELQTLEDLKDLAEHQQVTFTGKVLSVSAAEEMAKKGTRKQLHKQDFVIVDTTASCRGVAWEQHLHKLKKDDSYKIINATVRSFNGAKYLSLGNKAVITTVGDVGDVVDESTFDGSGGITVIEAEIVAVLKVDTYIGRISCNSKVVQVGTLEECSKCDAKMKISKCKSKHVGHRHLH